MSAYIAVCLFCYLYLKSIHADVKLFFIKISHECKSIISTNHWIVINVNFQALWIQMNEIKTQIKEGLDFFLPSSKLLNTPRPPLRPLDKNVKQRIKTTQYVYLTLVLNAYTQFWKFDTTKFLTKGDVSRIGSMRNVKS